MQRRTLLLGAAWTATIGLGGALGWHQRRVVPARPELRYPGMEAGHALRDGASLPATRGTRDTGIAILGAGVAGLACAWKLAREGRRDFVVVAGPEFGGNANAGERNGLAYPRGAHYLPLPSRESGHVREMLADFKLIERDAESAAPYYDERVLVHSPQERLLREGRWEDALLPMTGLPPEDLAQHRRFEALVERLRTAHGSDGRRLFAVPLVASSTDPAWRALDRLRFDDWLDREGYRSPALRWYLDYCCRDDYGAGTDTVSAWAGLHYFASRDGHAANAAGGAVLTWPGGLGPLVHQMRDAITARLGHTDWLIDGLAARVHVTPQGASVHCIGAAGASEITARRVVSAMPLGVAARVFPDLREWGYDAGAHASPHAAWLVSNFIMKGYPVEQPGESLAWDNVVYRGQALGYVVSTHQLLRVAPSPRTVFTAYQALSRLGPTQARQWLLDADPAELREAAAVDLLTAYGDDLWREVESLEITARGHAMAVPVPGYLSNPGLAALRQADGTVLFAHADLSGYSVFEEAAWWGVAAAQRLLG
ncbi:NAD(P)-binding protein [Pseudomonadota bacterium AL_CKDN230030165-1A_HGKHYDSX7]